MKKRFLSFLLTLSMVVGLVPMTLSTAVAGEPAQPEAQQIDRTGWIMIPSGELVDEYKTIDTSGKYYLDGDVTGNISISSEDVVVTLDLNGHVLQGDGTNSVVKNQGQLTITDSNPTIAHKYVVDESGLWVWNDAATGVAVPYETLTSSPEPEMVISVKGGCITGGNSDIGEGNSGYGGGIYCYYYGQGECNVKLSLNNINVIGNKATNGGGIGTDNWDGSCERFWSADNVRVMGNIASNDAGGVRAGNSISICLSNSTISHNTAGTCAGGIQSDKTTIIDRCIISYNESKGVSVFNVAIGGGGIYLNRAKGLIINKSEISHNIAAYNGGGILIYDLGGQTVINDSIIEDNTAGNIGGGVYYKKGSACLAAGTLVTMADDNTKKIEDVVEGDIVKTFDHESGKISSAEVYLAYKGDEKEVPFTLNFEDGNKLSIVDVHDLLEKESLSYVRINGANAENFVGKEFYGEDGAWHKLSSVTIETEATDYYSIYTAGHQNCFASGLLSCPDDMDFLLAIYDLDENLKADEAQLSKDIETYGLTSHEEIYERCGMSSELFDVTYSKYFNVCVGKGTITEEEFFALYDSVNEEDVAAHAPMMMAAPAMTSASSPSFAAAPMMASASEDAVTFDNYTDLFPDASTGVCNIGSGTKIVGNKVGENTNNLWISNDKYAHLYGTNYSDILVGVTLENTTGKFTDNGANTDIQYFFSDKEDYGVKYNESGYLEIVALDYTTTPKMKYTAKLTLSKNFDIGLGVVKLSESTVNIDKDKLNVIVDGETLELGETFEGVMARVAPKDVGKNIYNVVIYDGVIVKAFNYSVKSYCDAAFEAYAGDTEKYDKLHTLCVAIVNYGKYAEDYANGNSKSTVNAGNEIDPAEIEVPESTATFTPNAIYGGEDSFATIYPDSTLKLTYILKSSFAYDNSSTKTQNFFILNQEGKQITPSKVSVSCDAQSGTATITIELYAYQIANEYTLKVKGVDATAFTLSYGVYDYCSDVVGGDYDEATKNLCKMIYNYGKAVQDYIG